MSFEPLLFDAINTGKEINSGRYALISKERPHISKSKIDANGSVQYLDVGASYPDRNAKTSDIRYVAVSSLSYDLLLCVYDVNSSRLFATRIFKFGPKERHSTERAIASLHSGSRRNLEARLIGMQNDQDYKVLKDAVLLLKKHKIPINEIDLLGNNIRHVAVELSLGMTFNILLQDRIYRPGELNNTQTQEQFEQEHKLLKV